MAIVIEIQSFTFDGKYIYVCGGFLNKLDQALNIVAQNNSLSLYSLTFDGTYIYGLVYPNDTDSILQKIDTASLLPIATLDLNTSASAEQLFFDGTYIYTGNGTTTYQIDPVSMSIVSQTALDTGYSYTFDGTYIYASTQTSPITLLKINPKNMTVVSSLVGTGVCLIFDGTYIYGLSEIGIGETVLNKINPATMEVVSSLPNIFIPTVPLQVLATDGIYVYGFYAVDGDTFNIHIATIDPATMTVKALSVNAVNNSTNKYVLITNANPKYSVSWALQ